MPVVHVLFNPRSGSAAPDSRARIDAAFAAAGTPVRFLDVDDDGLAAARAAARDGGVIVAAGGDGTVSGAAGAAAGTGAAFGVIPLGTLNHFARDAGIPLDLDAAVRVIVDGHVDRLDVASANSRTFVNNASAGFYARLVRERQLEQRRGHAKWTAFALGLARAWRAYRPITVRLTLDGEPRRIRTPFVFVGNGSYVTEGLALGRRTSIATGRLFVYTAPECSRSDMLKMVALAVAGRLTGDVPLEESTAREVTIEPALPRVPLAADGELIAVEAPIECRVQPGALHTLTPRNGTS